MKYFYHLGYHTKKTSKDTPDYLNISGWDARGWVISTNVVEITKDEYKKVLEAEKYLIETYKIRQWHKPIAVEVLPDYLKVLNQWT
jgi:hypothetical protein